MNPQQRNFDSAGFLLTEAADHIAQAVRLITKEAARAKHITKDMSRMDPEWRSLMTNPNSAKVTDLSMQELTELATRLGGHHDQIRAFGGWLGAPEEESS